MADGTLTQSGVSKNVINLTGEQFGRLVVIRQAENHLTHGSMWLCICQCGNNVLVLSNNLRRGHTSSCGCIQKERITKHGLHQHPLYSIWEGMKNRCTNSEYPKYHNYGGRGITVCERWNNNPKSFIEWGLSSGWKPDLQIDRINNNKGYSPDNCRFVNASTNTSNRRKLSSNTTGFIGVTKHQGKYRFEVGFNGKRIRSSGYSKPDIAALARDLCIINNNYPHTLNMPKDFVSKISLIR